MNSNETHPKPGILIAFGGNALNVPETQHPHQNEEFIIARRSMKEVVSLIEKGYEKIILTHGNGPQVGQIFMQQELTKDEFPRQITLDVCVADSQGRIGYILQNVFDNVCAERGISKRSFAVITQVIVDPNDPGFKNPTKPIGVFYSSGDAKNLMENRGWNMKEDAGRGYRRVVPSPLPLDIVEKKLFRSLLETGFIAIGAGGGGIPVIKTDTGELKGVEAVIDKDRASSLLASEVGMDVLVILTGVDYAFLNFNSPQQKPIVSATVSEMENYLQEGHFLEGSMKPKVESAISFIKNGGKKAIIANLFDLVPAIEGSKGTHIIPDP
ncbi:MAG: carbamate kinase [Nitrospinaceae bacterium]